MTDENAHTSADSNPERLEGYLTKQELADRLKKTARTVEKWQRLGIIPYVKVGHCILYYWPEVDAHLRRNFGSKGNGTAPEPKKDPPPNSPPPPPTLPPGAPADDPLNNHKKKESNE